MKRNYLQFLMIAAEYKYQLSTKTWIEIVLIVIKLFLELKSKQNKYHYRYCIYILQNVYSKEMKMDWPEKLVLNFKVLIRHDNLRNSFKERQNSLMFQTKYSTNKELTNNKTSVPK